MLLSSCATETIEPRPLFNKEHARAVLRSNINSFFKCYGNKSKSSAYVKLKFTVNGLGRVEDQKVISKGLTKIQKSCISDLLAELRFPARHDGIKYEIEQPMAFNYKKK